jgi:hypothetical protein
VSGLLVDPDEDEALERLLRLVENPYRRILRAGEIAGSVQHGSQDSLEVKLGDDRAAHFKQALKLRAADFFLATNAFFQSDPHVGPLWPHTNCCALARSCQLRFERE